jgi:hypothetical protein
MTIQEAVFIWGEGVLAHPVNLLSDPDAATRGTPSPEELARLADKRLVLIDCRIVGVASVTEGVAAALATGKAVLLLCPSGDDLMALRRIVAILPDTPCAALLIQSEKTPGGPGNFAVRSLNYTSVGFSFGASAPPGTKGGPEGDSPAGRTRIAPHRLDSAASSTPFVTPGAADHFTMQVKRAMQFGYRPPALNNSPPTGLKYFLQSFSADYPFRYEHEVGNSGEATITFTWTVWGFLGQAVTGNSQYLIVEGRISLNAGTLYENDDDGRGFGNSTVKGTLEAPMDPLSFVPTSGNGTFTGSVSIPIPYKDPMGGYLVWTFTGSVNNTVESWSCLSMSQAAKLGAEWWFTSPYNAADKNTWTDALDSWDHDVYPFTPASVGTLEVNTISAWFTNALLTGSNKVGGYFFWEGVRIWDDGFFQDSHVQWWGTSPRDPGFWIDFNLILPEG